MSLYYINLAHRTDRRTQIEDMLKSHNLFENTTRIDAVYTPSFGALGCSLSHIKALEAFLANPVSASICIILEDDFRFNKGPSPLQDTIDLMNNTGLDWDVILIASNTLHSTPVSGQPVALQKCRAALSTSGYVVNRHYVKTLLDNFKEGVQLLDKSRSKNDAIDMHWKKLQSIHDWYIHVVGHQQPGYSDIEKCYCNYGV